MNVAYIVWRLHAMEALGHKKGNVGADIVFYVMRDRYEDGRGAILVSGDGDFCRTMEHVHSRGRLKKIPLPSRKNASSLYNRFGDEHPTYPDGKRMRGRIGGR